MIEPKFERDFSCNSSGSNTRKTVAKLANGVAALSQGSRSESVESISSSNPPTNGSHSKTPSSISRNVFKLNSGQGGGANHHSRNSSMGSASDMAIGDTMLGNTSGGPHRSLIESTPSDNQSTNTSAASMDAGYLPKYGTIGKPMDSSSSEVRVKVNVESKEQSSVMYKKMSINDKYRTKDVKRLILEKFFLNPDLADKYTLVQILGPGGGGNNGELVINDNCNVFYAAKSVPDMQFVLRVKSAPNSFGSTMNTAMSGGFDSYSANTSGGSSGYYANNLQNQAKFTRHSLANLNHSKTSAPPTQNYAQLPPQHNGKPSKWWLKKILS